MSRARLGLLGVFLAGVALVAGVSCSQSSTGTQVAPSAGPRYMQPPPYWNETRVDVFPGMDGITLDQSTPERAEALRGRIVWNLWVGDSGLMWDWLSQHGFGTADLIKTIDSRHRPTRFRDIGIINQPGYMQATKPDRYGLFIDVPNMNDPDGHIDEVVDYNTYGRSSGVVGLRIADNPNFDAKARADWMSHIQADGVNHDFYETPSYYSNPKLVRPYVVGMACALCHVSFDPVRPPHDVNNPKWSELNDYVGAQYFNVAEFFIPRKVTGGTKGEAVKIGDIDQHSFIWQLIHTSRPGALDTSFIATDYLNNPGTMNGVFNVGSRSSGRLERAANGVSKDPGAYNPQAEYLTGGALDLKWLSLDKGQLVPRVLKQGDDSVGFEGALSRVYVNIGHAWPQWQQHFRPLVGGPFLKNKGASQSPVTVREMQTNSASWNWSEDRSHALALYFIENAKPLLLKDAPGGAKYLTSDESVLAHGRQVFADNCAACHSSRQPSGMDVFDANGRITEPAKAWFRDQVKTQAFWDGNFLSDERRHPVTQIGTNATRAAATNATRNHIWDNFSSETYKNLPKIPPFEVDNPYSPTGKSTITIPLPGEETGPGYYRPPSLVSLWTSAPYLHNNTVGPDPMTLTPDDVTVDARMKAFQAGIEEMLWMDEEHPRGRMIWTTTQKSTINIPMEYLPEEVAKFVRHHHADLIDTSLDALEIGPIPANTPVNLIANTNLDLGLVNGIKRLDLITHVIDVLSRAKKEHMTDDQVTELMRVELVPRFLALNKCPDFYEDKGHEFGRHLPREDKLALIELLKTF